MKQGLANEMVIANAGSGKTHRLTTRMVTLLVMGVEPRKIAALTFTRKAAGEFLDSVFQRLAEAAADPARLEQLGRDTGLGTIPPESCRQALRTLVTNMGGLCMGTIDGLFVRIARAFPLEAGIPANFTLLGTSELQAAREEAVAAIFREEARRPRDFVQFIDLLRRLSRHSGERGVFTVMMDAVEAFHARYAATPPRVTWGDPATIWPQGCAILSAPDLRTAADALLESVVTTHPDLDASVLETWTNILALAQTAGPATSCPRDLESFITTKLSKTSEDSKTGKEYIPNGRAKSGRVYLNDRVGTARAALIHALAKLEIQRLLRRSEALHAVMRRFEAVYSAATRQHGRLTFTDITDLLAARVDDPQWTADVGYRLDARCDHWLLDEFQDTSRAQWRVLSSFIDEVVQDAGEQRSFFYVGDTKQALYSWRGGDPTLFFEIRNLYNSGGEERIRTDSLSTSYRSAKDILDVVNAVFGDIPSVQDALALPDRTVMDWVQAWTKHAVADTNKDAQGYFRWVQVEKTDADDATADETEVADQRDIEVLGILRETEPWRRGLSCAVLFRKNRKAAALAALLRASGIPVTLEGKANPCTDNPLGSALLRGMRYVACPEDDLAGLMLSGSPLAPLLADGPFVFREQALEMIADAGFEHTIRHWVTACDLESEPFLAASAEDFFAAASAFDASGRGGILDFIAFIESYEVEEPETADVVRVMTIHQAKGLTFDMTIVCGLDEQRPQDQEALVLGRPPEWGMILPKKALAEQDPTLASAAEAQRADDLYGELCSAYVAMTRPRYGLYVVTKQLKEDTRSKNFARLLMLTLGDRTECGARDWFMAAAHKRSAAITEASNAVVLPVPLTGTPKPLSPSSTQGVARPESATAGRPRDAAALGSEIHTALAGIEWFGPTAPDLSACSADAARILGAFLSSPTAREIFQQPDSPCMLWREKAFDVLIEGQWVSGIFDRVEVLLLPDGRPASATVYDFKTDRAAPADIEARYASQMRNYAAAAALLLGLDHVETRTIPVRAGA